MQIRQRNVIPSCLVGLGLVACGGGGGLDVDTPWQPDQVTVVSPAGADPVFTTNDGNCIDVPEFGCVESGLLAEECGAGEAADVIVDDSGAIVDVICLPPDAVRVTPEELEAGEIPQDANRTAVDFTGTTTVYEEDLVVDANGVVLYGEDPDDAVIEGDLEVTGNNTVVRGLTIDGDVSITLNNAQFVFCRITGDVTITFNNAELIGCEIFGNVTITGNNTVLNGNLFGGDVEISGRGTLCDAENYAFVDENENFRVSEEEVGERLELDCRRVAQEGEPDADEAGAGAGGTPEMR